MWYSVGLLGEGETTLLRSIQKLSDELVRDFAKVLTVEMPGTWYSRITSRAVLLTASCGGLRGHGNSLVGRT